MCPGELESAKGVQAGWIKIVSMPDMTFKGKYKGCNQPRKFKNKLVKDYKFEIDGAVSIFTSGSVKFERKMNPIAIDTYVKIKRTGEGTLTEYEVTVEQEPLPIPKPKPEPPKPTSSIFTPRPNVTVIEGGGLNTQKSVLKPQETTVEETPTIDEDNYHDPF